MKTFTLIFTLIISSICLYAQTEEDLLNELTKEAEPIKYAFATFKSTRIINSQTIETVPAKHLDFRISHRFGELKGGLDDVFGLDNASIRLACEYGITKWATVGFARSSYQRMLEGFTKVKLLRQSSGKRIMPISLSVFGSACLSAAKWSDPNRENYFTSRLAYAFQVLVARKFGERISLQLMPTWIHRNLVARKIDENDVFAVGIGGRVKCSKRIAVTAEYFALMPGQTRKDFFDSFSLGMDFETGGHVFQLHFTNSVAQFEPGFIALNSGSWYNKNAKGNFFDKTNVRFGFNIVRTISFDKQEGSPHNASKTKSSKQKKEKKKD